MSSGSGVGFAVADGDPARLYGAAGWHETVADDLDGHAALIDHTAGSLTTLWQGNAASSYQALSGAVAAHFRIAADCSRSASITLRRYAHELDGYQQEGRHCLAEAEHWQQQVMAGEAKLARAERSLRAAEAAVSQAQRHVRAAASAGAAGPVAHAAATAALADAQSNQAAAHAAVRDAQRVLHQAEDELRHWQARGRQVWEQARDLGTLASRTLATLSVPPPPSPPGPASASGNTGTGSPGAVAGAGGVAASAALGGSSAGTAGGAGSPSSPGAPAPAGGPAAVSPPAAAGMPAAAGPPAAAGWAPGPGAPARAGMPVGAGTPAGAGTTAGGPNLPAVDGGARQGAITFGDLEEIGHRFGWSHSELEAWWQVISDESGGNPSATNPGSGAFGIGQFLGSTYTEYLAYGAGSPNPVDQLNAMAQYIHNRYGNPLAALAHENTCHWY